MSNGISTIPVCAHAYCASKGFHIKLNDLLTQLRKEKTNGQGLIDLGNGCFVSPLDTQAGLEELIRDHSGIANLREVLEFEYQTGVQNALDESDLLVPRPPVEAAEHDSFLSDALDEDEEFDDDDEDDEDDNQFDDEDEGDDDLDADEDEDDEDWEEVTDEDDDDWDEDEDDDEDEEEDDDE